MPRHFAMTQALNLRKDEPHPVRAFLAGCQLGRDRFEYRILGIDKTLEIKRNRSLLNSWQSKREENGHLRLQIMFLRHSGVTLLQAVCEGYSIFCYLLGHAKHHRYIQSLQELRVRLPGAEKHHASDPARRNFCAARAEWRGQDDAHQHGLRHRQSDCGHGSRKWSRHHFGLSGGRAR